MKQQFPKLRALDLRPYTHRGQSYLLLRDPQQVAPQPLLVPKPLTPVLACCDGTHSPAHLKAMLRETLGAVAAHHHIDELLHMLDEALMLENDRYRAAHQETLQAYRTAPCRQPSLAGLSYPKDATQLWQLLQDYLEDAEAVVPMAVDWSRPLGMLSPHIDYPRGGAVYAKIWKRMAQAAAEAELVILFGTDHYGSDLFTLTRQNYATPYGILPTEQSLVAALAEVIGEEAAFAGELRHRGEHSLELVAIWLHHMRAGTPCTVVPILCGGFHRFLYNGQHPQHNPTLQRLLMTIQQQTAGRRVLVVASGDLAHVGPAFGGQALDSQGRMALRRADDALIAAMSAGDVDQFYGAIRQVRDANNVCGVAPIYLTMQAINATRGEAVGYATCPADDFDTSVVTIGGMVFRNDGEPPIK